MCGMGEPSTFEAIIIPHRSLSGRGLRWLAGFILVVSAGISLGLSDVGAWPAVGINGVEIALALYLLRRNARGRLASEVLILSGAGLRIVRTDVSGHRAERSLAPGWLRCSLEERPGRGPALWLAERGYRMEVGADLGDAEKRDLALALATALDRLRHPVFDNPQLR